MKQRLEIVLHPSKRARFERVARSCGDAALRTRYMIVVHSSKGWARHKIAEALGCHVSTVDRVRARFLQRGETGLIDQREDNGDRKADEEYQQVLLQVLEGAPRDHGHRRPTWTQRLLIQTMERYTGVTISRSTMSRLLKRLGVRHGRPKPTVGCPWSERARKQRLVMIRRLIETLPRNHVAVWEDEVDIDLNPRIGPDWMLPGSQRCVVTPGKNVKRYLAGAMDAQTDRITWIKGARKNSLLFIKLLEKLDRQHADKSRIHVILDNYVIHSSKQTQAWLREHESRFRLHFLPPYCPDDNRIERKAWRELHANVTYNHTCEDIDDLVAEAGSYLRRHNRRMNAELRKAI